MTASLARRLLRQLFLALLVATAVATRGVPSPATAVALASLLLAFAAARVAASGRVALDTQLRAPVVLFGLLVVGATAAHVAGVRGELQMPWVTLVGVPLALLLVVPSDTLVPRAAPLTLLFFLTLTLGLLGAEPWTRTAGRWLLAALALVGVTTAILDTAQTAVRPRLPPPSAAAWRRVGAVAVVLSLVALLVAFGVDALLAPLPRVLEDEPVPVAPAPDRLADRIETPERAEPKPETHAADEAVALVRVANEDEEPPRPLHLRRALLEEATVGDGLAYLAARDGPSEVRRDGDDGVVDERVAWPEPSPRASEHATTFQVTIVAKNFDALLVVPTPRWVEGHSLAFNGDGSIARPSGGETTTYRTAGSPRDAFEPRRSPSAPTRPPPTEPAVADARLLALPESFDGRAALERLLASALPAAADDETKARAITDELRRRGHVDATVPFTGWTSFAAALVGKPLHFAQCEALLLRLAKVPSRVVVGYACDDYEPKERRFDVRPRDEHEWVEAYVGSLGWIDLDPVARMAPTPGTTPEAPPPDLATSGVAQARSAREAMARERPLVAGLLLLLLVVALVTFPTVRLQLEKVVGRRGPPGVSGPARRAWRFWQELIDCCRRFGLDAHPAQTASEFAEVVRRAAPAEEVGLVTLLRVYHGCRFGGVDLSSEEERSSQEFLRRLPLSLERWRRARVPAPSRR